MIKQNSIEVVGTGFTVLDRLYADGDFAAETLGGSCGNVLLSLAMLHRQVAPVLSLGCDDIGERLVHEFRSAGANTSYIYCHEGRRSPVLRQELDTYSGQHSFSFTCRDTLEEFPRYEPISLAEVEAASLALDQCSVFYADRLSLTTLDAMERAHLGGAIVYFEPSDFDPDLFDDALAMTTVLKYSSDRLGSEIDEKVALSAAISIVTYGAEGLEVRHGHQKIWSDAVSATEVMDTCGSGDMVSVGLIDWLLNSPQSWQGHSLGIHDLMGGVLAGQRLAAENCAFAGARGLFQHRDAAYVRAILSTRIYEL